MASHLTAGSISRAQQRPTAHSNVCSPVDEFAQSVASNINASVASTVTAPPGCGMLAAAQPAGSTFHSLLREEQQPGAQRDVSSQQAAAGARVALSSPACSSGDAAAERACSWYGQRVWARAASAQLASGVSQTAAAPQGPGCAPAGVDVSGSVNASPQQLQAWKFSVMCYNILADTYAQYFAPKLYRDVPRPYLDWNHRLRLLVEEIRHWAPDVVCLQEVQHYDELEPEMRAAGYEGRFMRRTGRRRDGCATFWRSDRLRACSIQRLDFAPLGLEDNVAMLLSLAPRCEEAAAAGMDSQSAESLSSVRLLVATTHITFDPAKGDVKLGQVRTLLSRAADLAAKPPPEEQEQELLHGHSHQPHGRQHQHHNQHPHSHYHNQHYHSHPNLQEQRHHHHSQQHSNHHHYQNQNHSQQHNHQHGQDGEARLPQQQQQQQEQQQHRHHHHNQIQGQSQDSAAAAVEGRWRRPSVAPRAGGSMVDLLHGGQQHQQQHQQHPNQQHQQRRRSPLQTLAIITGDFNSTAGSPLYQFVARGSLDLARTNRKKLSGQLHGVCHTQYKPVSEVKQLHAQCTAAAAAAAVAATTAAGSDAIAGGGETSADTPMVTAAPASPPGTPPSTPFVTAAAPASASTEAKPAGSGSGTATPASVVQRLANAAMDSASTAIRVCTAKAAAAASCPNLASPAARAAAAVKVLDAFLTSPAAGAHRGGAERWSEKELRCAMGDQYDAAVVQLMDGGVGSVADAAGRAIPTSASVPTFFSGAGPVARCGGGAAAAADSSSQLSSHQQPKMGRQQNPPAVNRLSLNGVGGPGGAGAGSGRRSLDLGRSGGGGGAAAAAAAQGAESGGPLVVRHPLRLKSSYVEVARAEPAFTSIHSGFMGTVDFIWYTADAILQQQHPQQGPVAGEQAEAAPAPMPPAPASAAAAGRAAAEAPASSATMAAAAAAVPCDRRGAVEDGSQQLQSGSPQEEGTCGSAADSAAAGAAGDCAAASEKEEEVGRRFQLVPVAVLQPPDLELLPQGLPAAGWGSDHVCVVTHFELRPVA